MSTIFRFSLSAIVILVAIVLLAYKYMDYLTNPWTRDGQVMANVVQVAARISGPIVALPIQDNQEVQVGDILFRIDPRTFQSALDQAQANYDRTLEDMITLQKEVDAAEAVVKQSLASIEQAKSQINASASTLAEAKLTLERNRALLESDDVSQARYDAVKKDYDVAYAAKAQADAVLAASMSAKAQAEAQLAKAKANRGDTGPKNSRLRAAAAALEEAQLNLQFTTVRASVDGYVTNLNLRLGTQAVANQPVLALIDKHSFWIDAFFRETLVHGIRPGQQAVVTLMGHSDMPFYAVVDSLSRGISTQDGANGRNMLPQVSPTFQWIRLAQRIPVRIGLGDLPEGIVLRGGQTAAVLVHTGVKADGEPSAAPSFLQ